MKIQTLIVLTLLAAFTSCKVGNTPRYKTYDIDHTFTNIKGLDVPVFTEDKKVFVMTKELERDIKHSILGPDLSDEGTPMYNKDIKNRLIKLNLSPSGYKYMDLGDATTNEGERERTYRFDQNDEIRQISSNNIKELYFENKTANVRPNPTDNIAVAEYIWTYTYYPGNRLKYFGSSLDNIKIKGTYLNFDRMPIGTRYIFDSSGELIVSIDFEENFRMDFSELTARVLASREWLIEKHKNNFQVLLVKRNTNSNGSFWIVIYLMAVTQKEVHLIIDDATGDILGDFDAGDPELSKYTEIPSDRKNALEKMQKQY